MLVSASGRNLNENIFPIFEILKRAVLQDNDLETTKQIVKEYPACLNKRLIGPEHGCGFNTLLFTKVLKNCYSFKKIKKQWDMYMFLIDHTDVNIKCNEGDTVLHIAKYPPIVSKLLEKGANPFALNYRHETPLYSACYIRPDSSHSFPNTNIQFLLDSLPSFEKKKELVNTMAHVPFTHFLKLEYPIQVAVLDSNLDLVKLLLQYEAEWDDYLVEEGVRSSDIFELFLEYGYSIKPTSFYYTKSFLETITPVKTRVFEEMRFQKLILLLTFLF